MPKINRIRIANVPYSGRYIVDQLINCYDGQNVLLNLANGGGKSVLTQMIMQPIVPNVKIHKRKVESYLTSKEPTFVMIEWLLDNTREPTYFLTGIVMNKTVTEENNYRVRYFTFVNEYKSSNQYDIKNIEFITTENGITKYKSYDFCLKTLRSQEGSLSKIETFTIDEQKRYTGVLEEHGIFKDEWKILAKINEKEGGIDDLFEKCEKSDDVINQWILKTISEKLENADELREMFLNLMVDVMNHEEEIKQKEELDAFKDEANEYIKELANLLENMDKQESIKKELEEIYLKLNTAISNSKEKEQKLKEQMEEKNEELRKIDYEELSDNYYDEETNLAQNLEELEKVEEKVSKLDKEKNAVTLKLRLLRAAKIYEEYKEAKAEKEAAFIAKQNLENEPNQEERKNIEYSLKLEYENQINFLNEQLAKLQNVLQETTKKQEEIKKEEQKNNNNKMETKEKLAVTKSNIQEFKNKEKQILQKLGLTLTRNILQELDKKEIEKVINNYEEIEKNQKLSIKENEEKLEKKKNQIDQNIEEISNIETKNEALIEQLKDTQTGLDRYYDQTYKLRKILEEFAIDEQRIFDKETNLIEIERQRENVKKRNNDNIEKLNKNKEILYSLKNGGIHVELELGKILEKNKIEYETGEEYLKEQPAEFQQKLLQKNPMLPYCYIILKEKDYEKIENLAINEQINRLTPIILFKDIETDYNPQNKLINLQEKIKLACLYNPKAFDEKLKQEFENDLQQEIEELEEKIKEDENKIIRIENAINFIKEYVYTKNDEQNLKEKLRNIQEEIDNIKLSKENLTKENNNLVQEQIEINKKINELNNKISENNHNKEEFSKFLDEDKKYMVLITNQTELENIAKEIEKKEKEIIDALEKENSKKQEIEQSINGKQMLRDEIVQKNGKIAKIQDAKKLDNTLEELEKMLEEMNSKISRSRQEIEEKIDKSISRMGARKKELDKYYNDLEGKYEQITYVEEIEDETSKKEEEIQKDLEYARQEESDIKIKKAKLEANLENIKKNLNKMGKQEPIQRYLIKRNYEQRRKELKKQSDELNNNLQFLESEKDKMEAKRNSMLRIIEEPKYKEMDIKDFDYKNTPIQELAKDYKLKSKENEEMKRKIDNLYEEIKNRNTNQNQVILNFLKNMNPYQNENKFANYYFTYERVTECLETMEKMLQLLQTTIENIENDKNNIKHHAYVQGKNIYLEMKQISDSSDIKMPGKLRKVSLLEIELPKELDQFAESRIGEYIDDCIKNLRQECREQENIRQIVEKRIKDWLSDRQLLNIVINTENIGVKLYKIDISDKNSGLRRWEEVIVNNSGGEKLISCLILVLALMQYTRRKVLAKYGDEEKQETSKFLIIDNPFGKMSSTHLLDALMLILNRFNVQAICLSDLSQSSITNQFKVIYQMSLKTAKYSDKIYLTTDNVVKSPELSENYLLEQAFVKLDSQLKMW